MMPGKRSNPVRGSTVPSLALRLQKGNFCPPMIPFQDRRPDDIVVVHHTRGVCHWNVGRNDGGGRLYRRAGDDLRRRGFSGLISSATELVIAFLMGLGGSVKSAISRMVDIRLTLIILAGSLLGVQLGAIGTTYVKEHMIKEVGYGYHHDRGGRKVGRSLCPVSGATGLHMNVKVNDSHS